MKHFEMQVRGNLDTHGREENNCHDSGHRGAAGNRCGSS